MDRTERVIQYRRRVDLLLASAAGTRDPGHRTALLAAAKHFADMAAALEREAEAESAHA